ncbi:MAG: sigma-70 family RNA polymerase sigma factor [Elusimicrobia bacterium]|nr:sigma-70 family RNA polymerase sigma factor [Elusimicrobiota bacterium]
MSEEKETEEQEKEEPAKEEKTGEVIPKEKLSSINIDSTNQYIRKISQIDHKVSREESHELWKRVKRGDRRAKERIMELNLKLVIPIAKRFLYAGADLMDLVEEGNLGLLHAIDKFDPKKGFRFSTYASYWVEQHVRRSVEENSKTIRIPPHAWTALRKWLKQWDAMHGKLGRDPTMAEMAKHMHWNANQVRTALNASEIVTGLSSIETPLSSGDEMDDTVGDTLKDTAASSPDNLISILRLHDELKDALVEIGDRERMIVEYRYGLSGQTPMTLNDIGKKLNLSRERVRQIEERALLRLRRVAAKMGLIELGRRPDHANLQPGWQQPKIKTDILGDAIPTKPYVPRSQTKNKKTKRGKA